MLWGKSSTSDKSLRRAVSGFKIESLKKSPLPTEKTAEVQATAVVSTERGELGLTRRDDLEPHKLWIGSATANPARNDALDVCYDIVKATVAALCGISRIKSEIANDIRQKGEYLDNMANAYVVLDGNLDDNPTTENELRRGAIAMRDFCAFEASFAYFKDLSVWDAVRLAQEKLISNENRENLRYFYKHFAYMADNVTQHNAIAKAAANETLDILNRHLGTVTQAGRRYNEALGSIVMMGFAYEGFLKALEERFG